MIHFYYIGYFDPREPMDMSDRPYKPKPTRPIPAELLTHLAERYRDEMEEGVADCGSYLKSQLGNSGELHPFEAELVAAGCIVLNEMGMVIQPPEASRTFFEFCVERVEPRASLDTDH